MKGLVLDMFYKENCWLLFVAVADYGSFYCAIRLVAEMSVEKKQKSQKGKTKASEGRKHLSSVRVIQRNLVYIVGLPLNLADEDVISFFLLTSSHSVLFY